MLLRTGIFSLRPVFCSRVRKGMLRPITVALSHYRTVTLPSLTPWLQYQDSGQPALLLTVRPAWAGCLMISPPGRPLSTITCDVTPARPEIQTLGQRHTEKKYRGAREKIRRVYPSYWIFIPNRIPSFLPEQGFGSCILSKYLARPVKLNEAEKVRRSLCRVSCM